MLFDKKQQSSVYRQSFHRVINSRLSCLHPGINSASHSHGSLNKSVLLPQDNSYTDKQRDRERDRLTFKDIQNITKSMLKDRKAHEHNLGVLHNIKGKMYCLKLGEVSNFKQFSHYFYTSQYRRKLSKPESRLGGLNIHNIKGDKQKQKQKGQQKIAKLCKKISTQPSQKCIVNSLTLVGNYPTNSNKNEAVVQSEKKLKQRKNNIQIVDYDYHEDNEEEIKKIQQIVENKNTIQDLKIDDKLKQKVHKIVLPLLKQNSKQKYFNQNKEQRERQKILRESLLKKRQDSKLTKRYSINRML